MLQHNHTLIRKMKTGACLLSLLALGACSFLTNNSSEVTVPGKGKAVITLNHTTTMAATDFSSLNNAISSMNNNQSYSGSASIVYYDESGNQIGIGSVDCNGLSSYDCEADARSAALSRLNTSYTSPSYNLGSSTATTSTTGATTTTGTGTTTGTTKKTRVDELRELKEKALETCLATDDSDLCIDTTGPIYDRMIEQEMNNILNTIPGGGGAGCYYDIGLHMYVCS